MASSSIATPRAGQGLELLSKANALLTALEDGRNWSAQDLAQAAGEPVSTVYRLLANLVAIGWVDKGSTPATYRMGLYAMEIGGVCDDRLDLHEVARPPLLRLQRLTGGTSFLHVHHGLMSVCVDRIAGRAVRSLELQLGGSLPLYRGAGPRALLAHLPHGEAAKVLDAFEAQAATDGSVPARSLLEHQMRRDAVRGYSVSDGDVTPGVAAIGAPVFNHRGELVAAVSVSGLRSLLMHDESKIGALVAEAAAAVSAGLGSGKQERS